LIWRTSSPDDWACEYDAQRKMKSRPMNAILPIGL
jgi:hypothetical protein